MALSTVRIAIFQAEEPAPVVFAQRGTFGNMFQTLLSAAAARLSSNIKIESSEFDVRTGSYPEDLNQFEAILITGSKHGSYDDLDWVRQLDAYILDVYMNHPHIKMFGSCFGHQIICQSLLRAYGVHVEKDLSGHQNGVQEVKLSDAFRKAMASSSKQSAALVNRNLDETPFPENFRIQFVHGDHVRIPCAEALPSCWTQVGTTDSCSVQGVYQPNRVLTLQGHFEFDRFANSEILKHFSTALLWTPEALQEYLKLVDADDDAEWIAEMVVRFFLEDKHEDPAIAGSEATPDTNWQPNGGVLATPLRA